MKLAYSTLGCPDWPIERVAEQASRLGYGGVEMRLLGSELLPADLPAAERRRIRRLFDDAGVAICCVATSARFSSADPGERAANEELAARYMGIAADWNCRLIRVFGGEFPANVEREAVIDYVADSLQRVGERGAALGVTAVLETHDGFAAGATVAAALAQVASPNVGALWDVHHPYRMGETAAQTMALLGSRLRHVHIKDARRAGDGWDLVLLGEGEVPVAEALAAIRAGGYDGWYCVEWEKKWHPSIPAPELAFPQHAAALRPMLA
jgi:sugar phosphate isomerase/epimerase